MKDVIFVNTKLRMHTKEHRNTEVHGTEIKEDKNTEMEKYRNIEIQKYRKTKVQKYRYTKYRKKQTAEKKEIQKSRSTVKWCRQVERDAVTSLETAPPLLAGGSG